MTTSAAPTILEVKGLGFRYPEHTLFSNWSASLSPGVMLVLAADGAAAKPDRVMAPGERVLLAALPEQAYLLVQAAS